MNIFFSGEGAEAYHVKQVLKRSSIEEQAPHLPHIGCADSQSKLYGCSRPCHPSAEPAFIQRLGKSDRSLMLNAAFHLTPFRPIICAMCCLQLCFQKHTVG